MNKASKTLNEVRSDACNVILAIFTVLAIVATGASMLRGLEFGWKPVMGVHVALAVLLLFTTVRRGHLSLMFRSVVVTAVPFIITIGGFLTYGRGNGTLMFMVTSCVLAGCFFSRRGALAVLALSLAALTALYFGYNSGLLDVPVNPAIFNMSALSWIALGLGVLIATAVPLIGISALLQSLEAERARADEAARARSDFLANISHELRTPMANIIGLAEVLKGTGLDDNQRGVIANMTLSGRNLLTMLNGLLDFTKLETGLIPIDRRPFRLFDEIHEICTPFEAKAVQKDLYFGIELADDLPEAVMGDNARFGEALSNLIDNAVKFTSTGGVVARVTHAPRDDGTFMLVCKVIDTGIGVSSADSARIFEPFIQVDMSTARVYGGAGLGLAICKSLAVAMGGEVSVSSELGAGSTFTLQVPLARAAPSMDGAISPADVGLASLGRAQGGMQNGRRPLRLLVADDDANMRTVAEIMLQERGHDVTLVEDGAAAMAAARLGAYDCIIMDMHMPIMTGPAAIRELRKLERMEGAGRRVPMIALSADVLPEHIRGFMDAGADAFIAKPVAWNLLEAKVQALTARDAAAEAVSLSP